jgi:hypothetical protein
MITDLDLADWALKAYAQPATIETADVHCLVGEAEGVQILALRGTDPRRPVDLLRDAEAAGVRDDPILGPVSESFLADAEQLAWRVAAILSPGFVVTGHSKGAADAQALAALLAYMGKAPARLTTFASPQLGLLPGMIGTLPGTDYVMQHDPIPDVPPNRGRPRTITMLPWIGAVPFDRLECHAMMGYRDAIARLKAA